jgi:hypothetical protein
LRSETVRGRRARQSSRRCGARQRELVNALALLEFAVLVATVEVIKIAVVALLAGLADSVAASLS